MYIVMARWIYGMFMLCFSLCLAQATPTVCGAAESGSFSYDILATEKLTMRITHQDIRKNDVPSSEDISLSRQNAAIESHLIPEKLTLKAELSQSCVSEGNSDKTAITQDKAWKAQLSGKESRFSWGFSAWHMGPAFMTYSNPLVSAPRSRYDFNSMIDLGPSIFSFSALKNHDYLDNNELNPMVETNTGTIRYTYARPGVPKLLTSYSRSSMEYAQTDTAGVADRNTSRTISLGTSFTRPRWSFVPTYILKNTQDISSADVNDIDTSLVQITGELRPVDRVSLAPLVSFSNTSRSDTRTRSIARQSALSSNVKLIPGSLDLITTLSHLNTRTKEGTLNTSSVLAGGHIYWSFDQRRIEPMTKALSIGGHFSRMKDYVGGSSNNEWGACMSLRIVPATALFNTGSTRATSYR